MYSIFGFISTQIIVQNRLLSSQKKFWSDFVHFFENWTNLEIWSVLKLPLQICCSKRDIKIFVSIFIFFCRFLNRNYFWYLNHMCSNVFSPKKTQGISLKSTLFQNCSYLPLFFSITRTISSLTVDWNNFGNKIPFLFSSLWRKRFMIFNSLKTTQTNPDFYSLGSNVTTWISSSSHCATKMDSGSSSEELENSGKFFVIESDLKTRMDYGSTVTECTCAESAAPIPWFLSWGQFSDFNFIWD